MTPIQCEAHRCEILVLLLSNAHAGCMTGQINGEKS